MNEDLARNILIAAVAATPMVGGPIAFLLDKYIPSEIETKKQQYIDSLAKEIEELKDLVKPENLESKEFKSIFIKLLNDYIDECREEKLKAFRKLTINIALEPYEYNKIDFFTRLIIHMVPDEIVLLHVFYRLDVTKELAYLDQGERRDIKLILSKIGIDMPDEYRQALTSELSIMRLVLASPEIQTKKKRSGIFLSELGEDFAHYVFETRDIKNGQ